MTLHAIPNTHGNYDILDETNTVVAQTVCSYRAEEFVRFLDNARLALEMLKLANEEDDTSWCHSPVKPPLP